jgi:hypothetical protein
MTMSAPTTTATNQGWLTIHEAMEISGVPYSRLKDLVEQGRLPTHRSGSTELYDPVAVEELATASPA